MATVKFKKVRDGARTPKYASEGAAGMDLCACLGPGAAVTIYPGQRLVVPTGIQMELPVGFEGQVRPRSGLAAKYGVTVLNAPGTVDQDFRGEVKVILINHGEDDFYIEDGDRIAQLVVSPVTVAFLKEITEDEELNSTGRGAGGLGSTGIK